MHFVITFAHMKPAAGTGNIVDFMGIIEKKSYWSVFTPLMGGGGGGVNRVEGRFSHSPFWGPGPFFLLCGNNFTKTSAGAHPSAVRIVANISHLEIFLRNCET